MSDFRGIMIGLLVLAAGLVDAVLVKVSWGQQFPHPAMVVLLAFGLGQLGLLAAWLAAGPGSMIGRVGVCLVTVTGFSWLLSSMTRPAFDQWLGFLELYLFAVAVPVFVVRCWVADPRTDASPAPARSLGGQSPRQWTLAGMMCLTSVIAVALSFARHVDFPRQQAGLALLSCAGFSLTTLVVLSIAWRVPRVAWRVPASLLTGLLVGAAVGQIHGSATYVRALAVAGLVQALVIVIAVDVVRVAKRQIALPADDRRAWTR